MKLPKTLDINHIMLRGAPSDITIAELRAYIRSCDWFVLLLIHCPRADVLVIDNDGNKAPDDTSLKIMRKRINAGEWHLTLTDVGDEGDGGQRAPVKPLMVS